MSAFSIKALVDSTWKSIDLPMYTLYECQFISNNTKIFSLISSFCYVL